MDTMRFCQCRIDSDVEHAVVSKELKNHERNEQHKEPENFPIANSQYVAVEKPLHVAGNLRAVTAYHSQAKGNHSGKHNADDCIRGKGASSLHSNDTKTNQNTKDRHCPLRINRENEAQSNAGKG